MAWLQMCKACSGIPKNLPRDFDISLPLCSRMKILPKKICSRLMWWRPRRDCERAGASLSRSLWAERSSELERVARPQDCKILFKIIQGQGQEPHSPSFSPSCRSLGLRSVARATLKHLRIRMWDYEWEVGGASKLRKGIQILLLGQKKDGPWHYWGICPIYHHNH